MHDKTIREWCKIKDRKEVRLYYDEILDDAVIQIENVINSDKSS